MKKTTFFLLSLLTVFVFTACSDGLDIIHTVPLYQRTVWTLKTY